MAETERSGETALRAARTAMYGLISERVVSGSPGDWMRFEDAVNAEFDRLLSATPPDTDPPRSRHSRMEGDDWDTYTPPDTDPGGLGFTPKNSDRFCCTNPVGGCITCGMPDDD